jgi:Protein of unknown function (DUF3551)
MRTFIFALGTLALASFLHSGPAAAQGGANNRWCSDDGAIENCSFSSFRQCMATVRGEGQVCSRNPSYAGRRGVDSTYAGPRRSRSYQ